MKILPEGERLIDIWQSAQQSLEYAKQRLSKTECELSNATRELGKFLLPSDASAGERYCVWFGDSLISAEIVDVHGKIVVEIRKRGKSLS